jgi:hypothetical protein
MSSPLRANFSLRIATFSRTNRRSSTRALPF